MEPVNVWPFVAPDIQFQQPVHMQCVEDEMTFNEMFNHLSLSKSSTCSLTLHFVAVEKKQNRGVSVDCCTQIREKNMGNMI